NRDMRGFSLSVFAGVVLSLASGCASDSGGTLILKFSNITPGVTRSWERLLPGPRMNMYTPSSFKLKIVSVYLSEDIDSSQKDTRLVSPVYINPVCQNSDSATRCDVAGGSAAYTVTDFFELAANSTTVGATIPTSAMSVTTHTYKYVRI